MSIDGRPKRRKHRHSVSPMRMLGSRRVNLNVKWDGSPNCGGGWPLWRKNFESELLMSSATTEAQKIAELKKNVSPKLQGLLEFTSDFHPIETLRQAMHALKKNYARAASYNPQNAFNARVYDLRMDSDETMQEYISRTQELIAEYVQHEGLDLHTSKGRRRLEKWSFSTLKSHFLKGLPSYYDKYVRKDQSKTWAKFMDFMYESDLECDRPKPKSSKPSHEDNSGRRNRSPSRQEPQERSPRTLEHCADGDDCKNDDCLNGTRRRDEPARTPATERAVVEPMVTIHRAPTANARTMRKPIAGRRIPTSVRSAHRRVKASVDKADRLPDEAVAA